MRFGYRHQWFVPPAAHPKGPWEFTRRTALQAEADGFHSFWLNDHFYNIPAHHGSVHDPFFDVWTTLPALSEATSRIRLGPLVSPVGYRNPALLARMVATLDVISDGRVDFGFGAGGYPAEYRSYGFDFHTSAAVRIAQMEEAVQLMKRMWSDRLATFHGEYFAIENAVLEPKPIQKPHPPLLIGGVGEKYLLRALARIGDACNLFGPPAEFARVRKLLVQYCEAAGRDESTIEKTTFDIVLCAPNDRQLAEKKRRLAFEDAAWKTLVGTPDRLIEMVSQYDEAGADQLLIEFHANDPESYALFTQEVMPACVSLR